MSLFKPSLPEPRPPWYAAIAALSGVVAIIVVQLVFKDGEPNSATVALAGLASVLIFAVVAPGHARQALRGVRNVKVAGIELALTELKRVERVKPLPGQGDGVKVGQRPHTGDPNTDLAAVIEQLEARLRFSWDILEIAERTKQTNQIEKWDYGAIVGFLRSCGLLDADEERFIRDSLRSHRLDLASWSSQTRTEFLDSAWQFAHSVRPIGVGALRARQAEGGRVADR